MIQGLSHGFLSLVLIKKGQFSGALSLSVLPRIMLWRVRKSGLKSLSTSMRFPNAEHVHFLK